MYPMREQSVQLVFVYVNSSFAQIMWNVITNHFLVRVLRLVRFRFGVRTVNFELG